MWVTYLDHLFAIKRDANNTKQANKYKNYKISIK
jgi:hypothetical protein